MKEALLLGAGIVIGLVLSVGLFTALVLIADAVANSDREEGGKWR